MAMLETEASSSVLSLMASFPRRRLQFELFSAPGPLVGARDTKIHPINALSVKRAKADGGPAGGHLDYRSLEVESMRS